MNLPLTLHFSPAKSTTVTSIQEAAKEFRAYIEDNWISAEGLQTRAGDLTDSTGVKVAYVSYNGRVWGSDGKEWDEDMNDDN